MNRDRFLELLEQDGRLLSATAARDLDAAVPTCPGWTVRTAVEHTAEVYEDKMLTIGLAGKPSQVYPVPSPDGLSGVEWYDDALRRALDVLRTTDPDAPSRTFIPEDQTAGFWLRRMAQETAMHRADVESAFGAITPIDAELAVDGVDEVLVQVLPGVWNGFQPLPELSGTVVVSTGGRSWLVEMAEDVTVTEDGDPSGADATITGEPSDVLLWLWGRAPDTAITTIGDEGAVRRLRERLAKTTE